MKVNYEIVLKVKIIHDFEGWDGLKDNTEMSEDIARLICDEVATAGGVATYEIWESRIECESGKTSPNNLISKFFSRPVC